MFVIIGSTGEKFEAKGKGFFVPITEQDNKKVEAK